MWGHQTSKGSSFDTKDEFFFIVSVPVTRSRIGVTTVSLPQRCACSCLTRVVLSLTRIESGFVPDDMHHEEVVFTQTKAGVGIRLLHKVW